MMNSSPHSVATDWQFPDGVTYLNHGSFGPSPLPVIEARQEWLRQLEANPMDFFVRRLGSLLEESLSELAKFVGCRGDNLVFVSNSTDAMNVVARDVDLQPGDEVLLTDHEYGAVVRIFGQFCSQTGARTVLARLPDPLTSKADIVEAIFEQVSERTKLLVVSHITSPTAVTLPVREICARARERGIMVAVDGPHAPAQIDVQLDELDCDYYCASCHKWLSAPFGAGFLYVRSRHKQGLQPNIISWGRSFRGEEPNWKDEFHWPGTYDPTPFLTVPVAIRFLKEYGLDRFRTETHALAQSARVRLLEMTDAAPITPDSPDWYGSMVTVPISVPDEPGFPIQTHSLQRWLQTEKGIEIPVIRWKDRLFMRVSCHLYNTPADLDLLLASFAEWQQRQAD